MKSVLGKELRRAEDGPRSKFALHFFAERFSEAGIALAGVKHDPMLYSYLLDPTYSSHSLAEVALRRFKS